ncbi:hypothetical protein D9M72_635430 [compost metagenome]
MLVYKCCEFDFAPRFKLYSVNGHFVVFGFKLIVHRAVMIMLVSLGVLFRVWVLNAVFTAWTVI